MILTFNGTMVSGKNQIGWDPRNKRRFPNARFVAWREMMLYQILSQRVWRGIAFPKPMVLAFRVGYWPADKRNRDVPGMMDALFHVLERGSVVEDDGQLKHCLGWHEHESSDHPGLGVEIHKVEPGMLESWFPEVKRS